MLENAPDSTVQILSPSNVSDQNDAKSNVLNHRRSSPFSGPLGSFCNSSYTVKGKYMH